MKKSGLKIGILSLCLYFFMASASAETLWSESFTSYTEGQNLHGENGWSYQNATNTGYKATQAGTALTYPHLISSTGRFVGGGSYQQVGIQLPATYGGTLWTALATNDAGKWETFGYNSGRANNTVWLSFLVRPDVANNSNFKFGFADNNIATNTDYAKIIIKNTGSVWGLSVDGGTTLISSGVSSAVAGTTFLMVVKLTFGPASTQADLYVNPTLDVNNTVPATPSATGTTATAFYFKSLPMYLHSGSPGYSIDEIRLDTEYANVVPNDLTTGLSTANEVAPFTVCAANNTLHLNFSKEMSNTQVTIFDVQGRQMTTALVSGKTPAMNIENLNKGIYIVRTAKGTARFIK